MAKPSDFVETEATSGEVPHLVTPPAAPNCPLCDKSVGKYTVTTRIPVLMPDGMWGQVFRPAHPYCAFMYEKGV